MGEIISVHSFRGGTGKSNLTANIATTAAQMGHRVAIVDTDIQSPGIHTLFGFDEHSIDKALNDYLWGKATIEECAYPIHELTGTQEGREYLRDLKLWLIPSSIKTGEIARILRESYDVGLLNEGFQQIIEDLELDYLFIDTHPGLNEETLLSVAISSGLIIILRPDNQDFQGTAVTVDVARKLEVPRLRLVVNMALPTYDFEQLRTQISKTYDTIVAGVLPLSDDVASNASTHVFSALYPEHPWSVTIQEITEEILESEDD
ncbi:MAG: CDP-3,6-dideoxy-D-glycero-L-glycero-4-hexulose-4-reductase [Phototrophicales bacterium]|nr:MAG: CDP-3,6-dideoxy-D-glycero-L-glycero-4-hexulose-4-reductase [Phototrophicales bacterium]